MIKVSRTRSAAKLKGFTGTQLETKLNNLVQYYQDDGHTGTVNFRPKNRQLWGRAKPQLKAESYNKCIYCEADTAVVAHGDVEHFRPKSQYWWLAYCYDNYTFSCQICNQTYKGDTFPVQGPRLAPPAVPLTLPTDGAELKSLLQTICPDPVTTTDAAVARLYAQEDAELINPYVADPEQLFAWKAIPETREVWLVAVTGSSQSGRAVKAAEDVLGLNRQELLRLRWNAYETLETLVLLFQEGGFTAERQRDFLLRIRTQAGADRPFAGMTRFFLKRWGLL